MPPPAAYADPALDELYRMLFDPARLPAADPGGSTATPSPMLALGGVIVEVGLPEGLDTLAAYGDGSVRFISHAAGVTIVDVPVLRTEVDALFEAAGAAVAAIGPWPGERPPPPPVGSTRLSFLIGSDYYFGQGPSEALAADPLAGPVMTAAVDLLRALSELRDAIG